MGFHVSVATKSCPAWHRMPLLRVSPKFFALPGYPSRLTLIEFPEFHPAAGNVAVPQITGRCMTDFHTEETRRSFMCSFSRMIVKSNGRTYVYACTLVDDDPDYILAQTLTEALQAPVSMKHHRCYSCFKYGASCSESEAGQLNRRLAREETQ